jgi:inner membrane protein
LDTLTHALTAIGLAQLAHLSPQVAQDPVTQKAIFWATMAGSQAPDLDIFFRFKGETAYLKHHRGFSHSLISQLLIPGVTTLVLKIIFPSVSPLLVFMWTLAAVFLHVFFDLLTSYGTQALLPFSPRKLAWDVLMIIELPILLLLGSGFLLVWRGYPPGSVFLGVFALVLLYILARLYTRRKLYALLLEHFTPGIDALSLVPTLNFAKWDFVVEKKEKYYTGSTSLPSIIQVEGIYYKNNVPPHFLDAALQAPPIRVFWDFTRHPVITCQPCGEGHEIKFTELRYRFRDYHPFSATVTLDQNLQITGAGLGKKYPRRAAGQPALSAIRHPTSE